MTRKGLFALSALLVATALLGAVALFLVFPGLLPRSSDTRRDSLSASEQARLRTGDVVLRKGVSSASDLITGLIGEGFGLSHCGLVTVRGGIPFVIHTLNGTLTGFDGVQIQPLEDFFDLTAVDTLVVVRPRLDETGLHRVLAAADNYLAAAQPFDNSYDLSDRSRLYCSELLTAVFEAGGLYDPGFVHPKIYQYLSFGLFFDQTYFEPVLSHNPSTTQTAANKGFFFPLE